MRNWKRIGMFACGALAGSYGVRLLCSQDAKNLYTHTTAAVLRMKDTVMKDITNLRENIGDIVAAAKDINEERQNACDEQMIEDAKALLAANCGDGEKEN